MLLSPRKNGLTCLFQARKRSTKIKFLGPETARWGGGLPREGVVAENFVPALETLSSLGFEERNPGCPGNFAGMSRTPGGVPKVCAKKLRAHFSFPIIEGGNRVFYLTGAVQIRSWVWSSLTFKCLAESSGFPRSHKATPAGPSPLGQAPLPIFTR